MCLRFKDVLYGKGQREDELPKELARRESQLVILKEAKAQLEQQAEERATLQEEKIESRKREEEPGTGANQEIWAAGSRTEEK